MNAQEAVRTQLGFWHGTLDGMMSDCGPILHKTLDGSTANSIAATYAHTVIAEDVILHAMLQGKTPLFQSDGWEAKTGVAFPGVSPAMTPEWAAGIKMNLPEFQKYAKAVYAATDAYLGGLSDADVDRKMAGPIGEQTVGWYIATLLGTHVPQHAGEVAAIKGVLGLKGLPF
ncbi:MAG: DinB family protein [Dehalococcoidia bacterium]